MKLLTAAARRKMRGDTAGMMAIIADGFLALGGVYVKFLQGVLLQLPQMRDWKNERRFDVYEDVPPQVLDLERVLELSFTGTNRALIASINPSPFAAGSFGQVYAATLSNGQDVIIKILRPGAKQTLQKDLKLIKLAARLLATGLNNFNLNIRALTTDFVTSTLKETDYIAEAQFAQELYELHKNSSTITIPKTYPELCSAFIITQEYIGGVSVAQLLRDPTISKTPWSYAKVVQEATGSDLKVQLINLGTELYTSSLVGRPLHGDPHPGNIRLLPDNKVGLLDFGIRARPSVSPRAYYLMLKEWWRAEYSNEPDPGAMFLSYIRLYSEKLYQSMQIISEYTSKRLGKSIKLDKYIAELGNNYFNQKIDKATLQSGLQTIREGKKATDISVVNVINSDNRFRLFAKIQDGPLLRSLVTYISLVTELGYRPIIPQVYENVMNYVQANLPELEHESPPSIGLGEAMETIYSWLEEIARTDYELYRLLSSYLQGFTDKKPHLGKPH